MTLDNLTTPFERRRVIEYGADGSKVVRHWYEVQHVIGSLYKSKDTPDDRGELEFKLFVFFSDKSDGMQFARQSHPERYTVEQVADVMRRCRVDSVTHMYAELNDRVEQNKFIRPLAKLGGSIKIADTSNQGESESKAFSTIAVTL